MILKIGSVQKTCRNIVPFSLCFLLFFFYKYLKYFVVVVVGRQYRMSDCNKIYKKTKFLYILALAFKIYN